jgi:two-component SAPR family response regulator
MIRLGICEDVYEEMIYCKKLVDRIMAKLSRNANVYSFQSGEDLLMEIEATGNMDILLVDIELLGGMNGVEFGRKLREIDNNAVMKFISSHDQYCKEVIDVQPYAFIDKPISSERRSSVCLCLKYGISKAIRDRFMCGQHIIMRLRPGMCFMGNYRK